jgi:hypothetical protein
MDCKEDRLVTWGCYAAALALAAMWIWGWL